VTTNVDSLVENYLKDLDEQLRGFPGSRRREILDEVREHIAAARADLDLQTEAGIRTVLERLGEPAEIAAEARERFGIPAAPSGTPWLEVIALVLLVIPLIGWIPAVVLIWVSRLWTKRDKIIAAVVPLGWLLPFMGVVVPATGGGAGPLEALVLGLLVLPFLLPFFAAIYLAARLRARSGTAAAAA
jgi:uncharacterized membrane protein